MFAQIIFLRNYKPIIDSTALFLGHNVDKEVYEYYPGEENRDNTCISMTKKKRIKCYHETKWVIAEDKKKINRINLILSFSIFNWCFTNSLIEADSMFIKHD